LRCIVTGACNEGHCYSNREKIKSQNNSHKVIGLIFLIGQRAMLQGQLNYPEWLTAWGKVNLKMPGYWQEVRFLRPHHQAIGKRNG